MLIDAWPRTELYLLVNWHDVSCPWMSVPVYFRIMELSLYSLTLICLNNTCPKHHLVKYLNNFFFLWSVFPWSYVYVFQMRWWLQFLQTSVGSSVSAGLIPFNVSPMFVFMEGLQWLCFLSVLFFTLFPPFKFWVPIYYSVPNGHPLLDI